MASELTPSQMDGHIAAMQAEPWGEDRADHRTAYLAFWIFNLLGSVEEGQEKPEAEGFLRHFRQFVKTGSTVEETVFETPDESAKKMEGRL